MTREWLRTIKAAQNDRSVLYQGHVYLRIPYGQEQWWGWTEPPHEPCRDCGCQPGQLHVTTCDVEECPICQPQQRLSCHHWWELRDTLDT